MLVFAHVSSMKKRRVGSMLAYRSFQRLRCRATPGRFCSLASAVFFEGEPFAVSEGPDRSGIDVEVALGQFAHELVYRDTALGKP